MKKIIISYCAFRNKFLTLHCQNEPKWIDLTVKDGKSKIF